MAVGQNARSHRKKGGTRSSFTYNSTNLPTTAGAGNVAPFETVEGNLRSTPMKTCSVQRVRNLSRELASADEY